MIYLHTYNIVYGVVHDLYNPIDNKYYSIQVSSSSSSVTYLVLTALGTQKCNPFTYTLPETHYMIIYTGDRLKDLENSKFRIALNSI